MGERTGLEMIFFVVHDAYYFFSFVLAVPSVLIFFGHALWRLRTPDDNHQRATRLAWLGFFLTWLAATTWVHLAIEISSLYFGVEPFPSAEPWIRWRTLRDFLLTDGIGSLPVGRGIGAMLIMLPMLLFGLFAALRFERPRVLYLLTLIHVEFYTVHVVFDLIYPRRFYPNGYRTEALIAILSLVTYVLTLALCWIVPLVWQRPAQRINLKT